MGRIFTYVSITTLLMSTCFSTVFAGSYNNALVLQQSPAGAYLGNTLSIDQSDVVGSEIHGVGLTTIPGAVGGETLRDLVNLADVPLAALQTYDPEGRIADIDSAVLQQVGEGNSAELTLTGSGGTLELYQYATEAGPSGGNTATLTANNAALGGVVQVGANNTADLTLLGTGATGLIAQFGSELTSNLNVGTGGSGTITQIGTNSTANATVAAGNSLNYTQVGDGLSTATEVSVFSTNTSSGSTIVITQVGNPYPTNVQVTQTPTP